MATKQETFDEVVGKLRAQNVKSISDELCKQCVYRGPNGLKCAAGHLIPDDLYKPCWEGDVVETAELDINGVSRCLQDLGHDLCLVHELQVIHDQFSTSEWERRFQLLAIDHGLSYKEREGKDK